MDSKYTSVWLGHIKNGSTGLGTEVERWGGTGTFKVEFWSRCPELASSPASLFNSPLEPVCPTPLSSSSITQFTLTHCWMPTYLTWIQIYLKLFLCFPQAGLTLLPGETDQLLQFSPRWEWPTAPVLYVSFS